MKRKKVDDYSSQVRLLLDQADALEHGPNQIELCEEAVRLADSHQDEELAFEAREKLVEASAFGGRPDLLIVHFSWCLAKFDKDQSDWFRAYSTLWRMKWVVNALTRFAEIELPTIHAMLDDMERRFREFDGSIQPVLLKRRDVAMSTGNLEEAARVHKLYAKMSRSMLSDCHACELDNQANYYFDTGRNALGIKKAEALFASGMACAEVPKTTYSDLLLPLIRLKRHDEAMSHHLKGYPKVRRSVEHMSEWSAHIAAAALLGHSDRAIKMFVKHLPAVESSHNPLGQLTFFRNSLVMVEMLADQKEKMRLRLPEGSTLASDSGTYVLSELAASLLERVRAISARFDQRNGNTYYTDCIDETRRMKRYAKAVPYSS